MIVSSNQNKIQKDFNFNLKNQNDRLIDNLVKKGAIKSKMVEKIMRKIDRKDFCPVNPYDDCQQIIGCEATICAPHLHAYSLEILLPYFKNAKSTLDIGTGSGYLALAFALIMQENFDKKKQIQKEKERVSCIMDRVKQKEGDNVNLNNVNNNTEQENMKIQSQIKNLQNMINNPINYQNLSHKQKFNVITNDQNKVKLIQANEKQSKKINLSDISDGLIPSIDESSNDSQIINEKKKQQQQNEQVEQSVQNDFKLDIISNEHIKSQDSQIQKQKSEFISVGIDHMQELAQSAYSNIQKNHKQLLDDNKVNIVLGDGRNGFKEFSKYDIIYVGGCVEKIPQALLDQLNYNGVMLIPIGKKGDCQFNIIEKDKNGKLKQTKLMHVARQPLQDAISQQVHYSGMNSQKTTQR